MRKVTVVGAGKSGVASANFLANRGIDVTITDSKSEPEILLASQIDPRVRRVFGEHPLDLLDNTDTVVLSPGVPQEIRLLRTAHARGIPVISEIELAFRHLEGDVVAITGSNGKSTTTTLIAEVFRIGGMNPILAGNIGDPLIGAIVPGNRIYVVELSSFQLETVETFRAKVALLLNIVPDHMDRYNRMEDYEAAKLRVFGNQTPDDVAIVNADDPRTANPPTDARVWSFSSRRAVSAGAWFDGESLVINAGGPEVRIPRSGLKLPGIPNVENALAAWLAARAMRVSDDAVREAFATFGGLAHRMVTVRELDGVRWINDSKGTNVDATLKSLEGFRDREVILILGGKDKKGEFERLRDIVERKVRTVLTIGDAAAKIESKLRGCAPLAACGNMQGAVEYARAAAKPGEVVLLSPACASFDQYRNFEERGNHFEELVRGLE
ncbi:MAG: UDP-N-acetylmuramoyl-L-alanine--D-glutamate ligase [Thermoanaerobaculia bacterium]